METEADPRIAFFDSIAEAWDGWHDLAALEKQFGEAFDAFGLSPSEKVLDIGCGTGNLTCALLKRLGPEGRVMAVDVSPGMLAYARRKAAADPRATWVQTAADRLPVADAAYDRVFCFSAWPHFSRPEEVVREFCRVLGAGGYAHVFHFISRQAVNDIHTQASDPSIHSDLLVPVAALAALFKEGGFTVLEAEDTPARYVLTVRKGA